MLKQYIFEIYNPSPNNQKIYCNLLNNRILLVRSDCDAQLKFVGLFPRDSLQTPPKIDCLNGWKVTLVADVWIFSTVSFQMSPQIACLNR